MEPVVGSILEGKVTTITKFGAFVALDGNHSGLVHISEIANSFVNDVHDYLHEGDTVKVKVLSTENGKINLSIKKALPPEPRPAFRGPRTGGSFRPAGRGPRPAQSRPADQEGGAPAGEGRHPRRGSFHQPLAPRGDLSFEDKLKQFMTLSDSKMADLNRNIDGKRGGRRRK